MNKNFNILCLLLMANVAHIFADNVWLINTTDKPAWVYVSKAGRAGADKMAKDVKAKLESLKSMNVEGVNISDIYMWPSEEISPEGKEIRTEAKKLGLHVGYKNQERLFLVDEQGTYKLLTKTPLADKRGLLFATLTAAVTKADKQGSEYSSPWVGKNRDDVLAKFKAISSKGQKISGWDVDNLVPSAYSPKDINVLFQAVGEFLDIKQREEGWSHIQGIKRLPAWLNLGQYLYLTAGNYKKDEADLFIIKLDSESPNGVLQGNSKAPKAGDRVVKRIILDKGQYWHACGIDICGKYVVIPVLSSKIPGQKGHKVAIYDISKPEDPTKVLEFKRAGGSSAVTLVRLPNDYYLLAHVNGTFDFYYSKSTNLLAGFYEKPTVSLPRNGIVYGNPQNINFITAGDGTLMMVGSNNTKNTSPIISGDDFVDLYEITYDLESLEKINQSIKNGQTSSISPFDVLFIERLARRKMSCNDDYCNFAAAADIDIVSQDRMSILGVYHWAQGDKFRMTIFSAK